MTRSSRRMVRVIGAALILSLAGCWDYNKTFVNNQECTMTRLEVYVLLPGHPGGSFPVEEDDWWNDNPPDVIRDLGNRPRGRSFCLEWNVNVPPGGNIHVGWEFKSSDQKYEEEFAGLAFGNDGPCTPCETAGLVLKTSTEPGLGLVMEVSHSSDTRGPIIVEELQWAANSVALPLGNLVWGDPLLESLTWGNVTSVPFPLDPGSPPLVFDVPDEMLPGNSVGLVRYIVSDSQCPIGQEAVYQSALTLSRPVPLLGQWGLPAMVLLMLAAAALVLRGRRARLQAA